MNLYGFPQAPQSEISMTHTTLGMLGELTIASALQRYGFKTYQPAERQQGDLVAAIPGVDAKRIEVKTAKRGSRGSFQFCLRREKSAGYPKTDHRDSDFLVLLCVENDFSVVGFLMPVSAVSSKKIEFRDPFNCKFKQYLAWQ